MSGRSESALCQKVVRRVLKWLHGHRPAQRVEDGCEHSRRGGTDFWAAEATVWSALIPQ
jgi:hypothetical protein